MNTNNQKIGQLIQRIRQERGLTQAEFAKRLSTSQSAINRIEQGKQNLSLDTIARISTALGRDIVTINPTSLGFEIEGGHELHGEITMNSSKNAAVAILAGAYIAFGGLLAVIVGGGSPGIGAAQTTRIVLTRGRATAGMPAVCQERCARIHSANAAICTHRGSMSMPCR